MRAARRSTPVWSLDAITCHGERVTHLYPNDCYFAHLSIYAFAASLCRGKRVIDAGSGAGYGSHYLATHGAAHVVGLELNGDAVAFSRSQFRLANLDFRPADLQEIRGFPPHGVDVVFSSNVLEHVPDVAAFLRGAWTALESHGTLVVAVPPIVSEADWNANRANPYHLNIWTPRQWLNVLGLFFEAVQPYRHDFCKPGVGLDFTNRPDQCSIDEDDFRFDPVGIDDFYEHPSLTVVLVATAPRPQPLFPGAAHLSMVEGSFSRAHSAAQASEQTGRRWLAHTYHRAASILRHEGLYRLLAAPYGCFRRRAEFRRRARTAERRGS